MQKTPEEQAESQHAWDKYFISLCYFVATKSKDENTNVGAVVIGPDKEIRSTGYNSFPRGCNDSLKERQERPEKYYWFAHGEENAITNAARMGISLKGCTIYITGIPCMTCARLIVQSGISEVVYHSEGQLLWGAWNEHIKRTSILFEECEVKMREFSCNELVNLDKLKVGGITVIPFKK